MPTEAVLIIYENNYMYNLTKNTVWILANTLDNKIGSCYKIKFQITEIIF